VSSISEKPSGAFFVLLVLMLGMVSWCYEGKMDWEEAKILPKYEYAHNSAYVASFRPELSSNNL
jgi:hypothetical protein